MILACGGLPSTSDTLTPSDETVVLTPQELVERTDLPGPLDEANVHCHRTRIFANVGVSCAHRGPPETMTFSYKVEEYPFDSDAERGLETRLHERTVQFRNSGYSPVAAPGLLSWGDAQHCVYWQDGAGNRLGPYCQAREANRTIVFDLEWGLLEGVVLDDVLRDKLAAMDAWTP